MTAKVIPLRKPKNTGKSSPDLSYILTREIMREYSSHDAGAVERAIGASNAVLAKGGGFFDAMEAASRCIEGNHDADPAREEVERNFQRHVIFLRRRQRIVTALLRVAEVFICARMQHSSVIEIEAAVERARRVLEGGGHIDQAIRLALPDGLPVSR
jgi:hypothetical protein